MAHSQHNPFASALEEQIGALLTPQLIGAAFGMIGPVMNVIKAVNEAGAAQAPPPATATTCAAPADVAKESEDFMKWEANVPASCVDELTVLKRDAELFCDTVVESSSNDGEYKYTYWRVEKGSGAKLASRIVSTSERLSPASIKAEYLVWSERISPVVTL